MTAFLVNDGPMAIRETITVWVPFDTKRRLGLFVASGKRTARQLKEDRRPPKDATAAERALLRATLAAQLAGLRRSGQLLDTIPAVLEYGARLELAERPGFDEVHGAPPADALLPGRWPGTRDSGCPEKITARVDAALVAQVRAACWGTSAEAIDKLRAWRDRHPYSEFIMPGEKAMEDYTELADKVTTPGALWRAALARMLPDPFAPQGDSEG
jgi:hypothetical protein